MKKKEVGYVLRGERERGREDREREREQLDNTSVELEI